MEDDDIEMRWMNAWSDVAEIVGERWNVQCLLPDGNIVESQACQYWLQDMVYKGWFVKVEPAGCEAIKALLPPNGDRNSDKILNKR